MTNKNNKWTEKSYIMYLKRSGIIYASTPKMLLLNVIIKNVSLVYHLMMVKKLI